MLLSIRKSLIAWFVVMFVVASGGCAQAQNNALRSASIKVVLLGTGGGPPMNLERYEASTLVEAGGKNFCSIAAAGQPSGWRNTESDSAR